MKPKEKAIRYHQHAEVRMAERGISKAQIVNAVRNPDAKRPARRDDAQRMGKAITRRKRLAVIASEGQSEFWVISAFWMST